MTLLALVALAVAALSPIVLTTRIPLWVSPLVATLGLVVAAVAAATVEPVTGFALAATLVLCVAAATTGGAPLVLAAFRIANRQSDAGIPVSTAASIPAASIPAEPNTALQNPAGQNPAGPLRGGRIIGLLERSAVAVAVLAAWPEGIAIVLAVKGLARYPELREPHASEQFIIGTFTSVLWALAVCGIGRALIT